eukprot:2846818-Rhodomonas_salina.1
MARIAELSESQQAWGQRGARNWIHTLRRRGICISLQAVLFLLIAASCSAQYARPSARRRAKSDQETDVKQAASFSAETANYMHDPEISVNKRADAPQTAGSDSQHVKTARKETGPGNSETHEQKTGGSGKQAYVTMVTTTKYVWLPAAASFLRCTFWWCEDVVQCLLRVRGRRSWVRRC